MVSRCLTIPFIFLWHMWNVVFATIFFTLLSFASFCFFTFKLLQLLATRCVSQFVRFLWSLQVCKIDCVSFCFFASRFLFFICKVFGFCKVLCVVECCDLCKSCHLAIVATLWSYWCTSFLFFFSFLVSRGFFLVCWFVHCYKVMLLRDTTCASIVMTLSNWTCLCVFKARANYFVKEGFVKHRKGEERVWAKGNKC